jgi:uncharacterized protein YlxW (UPF0749 family)
MIDKKHWMAMTLVCFIIGLLLMVQLHTQAEVAKSNPNASINELTGTLIQMEKKVENLGKEAEDLRGQLKQYKEGEGFKRALSEQTEKARMAAGMVELQGPGIIITLDDSPLAGQNILDRTDDVNKYLIHDSYLRDLVNNLWMAGAEAIAINEQRLVSSSEIECGGPTILVNSVELVPKFTIKAIGDPNTLVNSLPTSDTYQTLKAMKQSNGLIFDVAPAEKKITIPAFKGATSFRFATPVSQKGGEVQ